MLTVLAFLALWFVAAAVGGVWIGTAIAQSCGPDDDHAVRPTVAPAGELFVQPASVPGPRRSDERAADAAISTT